jgi:hypothetical protein
VSNYAKLFGSRCRDAHTGSALRRLGDVVYTSRMRMLVLVLVIAACGGGTKEGSTMPTGQGSGGGSPAKSGAAADTTFEVANIEIKGLVFVPEALGRPGVATVLPKGQKEPFKGAKLDAQIKKQKDVIAKTKNQVEKEAQAALYASMLYQKSKEAPDKEQKELYEEARKTLRDVKDEAGDKVDDVTLRMLATYEMMLDDYASADKQWGALVQMAEAAKQGRKKGPLSDVEKDEPINRAWWTYTLLKQYKNAEALAAIVNEKPDAKEPELAYATAWAKWRAGDEAGAWQAIVAAYKGWKDPDSKKAVERDVVLFAGRTNASLADAISQAMPVYAGKDTALQYEFLSRLGIESYQFSGRWADGVAALDKALAIAGSKVPSNDLPTIRYFQADYTVRLDDPASGAKLGKQAIDALPNAGEKLKKEEKDNLILGVWAVARMFHNLYATPHDARYYQPAHDLYALVVPLITSGGFPQKQKDEVVQGQIFLEKSLAAIKAGKGGQPLHDKDAIGALLQKHNQEIQACYEQALAANKKLGGNLKVTIEADQTGAVKGVATEPKSGAADLAAVAGCVEQRAQQWKLPKREGGAPGSTRIRLDYVLATRK